VSRANIEIEGDFVVSGKESISVEFLKGNSGTAHLTQLGSMSLLDTSMAGDLLLFILSFILWIGHSYNNVLRRPSGRQSSL